MISTCQYRSFYRGCRGDIMLMLLRQIQPNIWLLGKNNFERDAVVTLLGSSGSIYYGLCIPTRSVFQ